MGDFEDQVFKKLTTQYVVFLKSPCGGLGGYPHPCALPLQPLPHLKASGLAMDRITLLL